MALIVIARWPRDRRGIVRMKTKPRRWDDWRPQRGRDRANATLSIELQPKCLSKRRKSSLGCICFRSLQSDVVHFTRRIPASFAGTVSFTDNCRAIGGDCYSYLGEVDRQKCAAIFPSKYA